MNEWVCDCYDSPFSDLSVIKTCKESLADYVSFVFFFVFVFFKFFFIASNTHTEKKQKLHRINKVIKRKKKLTNKVTKKNK